MQTLSFPAGFAPLGYVLFTKTVAFVQRELAVRAAVRELRHMDDRSLADIGICRGEIKNAVRGRLAAK
jgi:hypothetical protein